MVSFMLDHIEQVTLVPSDGNKDSTFCREDLVSFLTSSYFHRYPWGNQSSIVPTQMNALTATKKITLCCIVLAQPATVTRNTISGTIVICRYHNLRAPCKAQSA